MFVVSDTHIKGKYVISARNPKLHLITNNVTTFVNSFTINPADIGFFFNIVYRQVSFGCLWLN
jgi:hypothetical protein